VKLVSVRASPLAAGSSARGYPGPPLQPHWYAIELTTDAGLTGIGFGVSEHLPLIERLARELLIGADPRGVTGLWQRMVDAMSPAPYAGASSAALAALDLALWDLKAKANAEPLWRTLGATRPRINVHVSVPLDPPDTAAIAAALTRLVGEHGFRGACLELSTDPAVDEQRLGLLRAALAPNTDALALMLNLAELCTPKESVRRVCALEREFDLTWVEAPARREDCAGYRQVSESCSAAVCGGRLFGGPADFLAHFRARSLDVVQLGFQNAGITGALQIADTALGFELPVAVVAAPGNLNAHLAAALPLCMSLEIEHPLDSHADWSSDVRVESGWATVGDRPGHGVVVAHAAADAGTHRRTSRVHDP
jgi:L-alanine-DL-glutamate epimerase-like enolase superfamily enzyme